MNGGADYATYMNTVLGSQLATAPSAWQSSVSGSWIGSKYHVFDQDDQDFFVFFLAMTTSVVLDTQLGLQAAATQMAPSASISAT